MKRVAGSALKFSVVLLTTLYLLGLPHASRAATGYAGEFLSVGASARGLALGGAYLALVNDATAGYWNPAALAGLGRTAHLMHSERFAGLVTHDYAAVNFERFLFFDGFSVGLLRLGVKDIPFTSLPNPSAPISADNRPGIESLESSSDYAVYISGGHRVSDRFDVGASLKVIYRTVASFSANGVGVDLGARYRLAPSVVLAATVRDATASPILWDTGATDHILPSLGIGLSLTHTLGSGKANLVIGSRAGGNANNTGTLGSPMLAGFEYDLGKLALRAGLQEEHQTLGVGIRARDTLRLDMAYQQHDELEATYVFSATTDF